MPNNGVCVVHYPFEYYCNIIIYSMVSTKKGTSNIIQSTFTKRKNHSSYLSPAQTLFDEFACRATADASVPGGIVARRREFRGRMAAHGDHRSARRHSRGSGSRLWPVPLPHEYYSRIIISASANSVRTAPPRRGAKNKRPGWF